MTQKRAIIAGSGVLPKLLAEASLRDGYEVSIIDFKTTQLDWVSSYPVLTAQFEKAGRLFAALHKNGISEVVFAGGMERPKLNPLKMDRAFLAKAPLLLRAIKGGDDGLLRLIADWFQEEGFQIIAPHEVAKDLLAPAGVWGKHHPSEQDYLDIDRGVQILDALAPADVAQACVIGGGICFGIESIQGTDALLRFVSETEARLQPPKETDYGVLVKIPKTGQETRLDLPGIGPDTISNAARAGLSGIALKEGGALVLGLSDVVQAADEAGLFILGLPNVE